jgi:O-antigen/teichoic acid export membrane protein
MCSLTRSALRCDTISVTQSSAPAERHEGFSALTNALKLASSLVVSFGITLALRQLVIPRYLGTERLGELNYADGLAGLFLVGAWLGIDVWIRKEMGITVKTADGLFGGILVVRASIAVVFTAGLAGTLYAMGRPHEIVLTAVVFGLGQVLMMMQSTASALLHAAGKVDGLSVSNIIGKLLWAGIVVPVLLLRLSIVWLAAAFAISEGTKAVIATLLVRHHTALKLTVDLPATLRALKGSLPFWVNTVALAGTGRADVAVLGTFCVSMLGSEAASNREVGWYTVTLGFGSMILIVAPVIGWVMVPMLARALKESDDGAAVIMRRSLEACVVLGMPLTIAAFVGAEQLMGPPFYKPEFGPAAPVLKILSITYVITYMNIVGANCLNALGRGWTVTFTSIAMVGLTPLLDLVLIPLGISHVGPSGGAAACAVSLVIAELLTTGVMLRRMGRYAVDRRLISVVLRTLVTAGIVIGVDFALRTQPLNPWLRIAVDAALYIGVALATGSVRVSEAVTVVKLARAQRSGLAKQPA